MRAQKSILAKVVEDIRATGQARRSLLAVTSLAERLPVSCVPINEALNQLHKRGVRFHASLVKVSGTPFFIDTIKLR